MVRYVLEDGVLTRSPKNGSPAVADRIEVARRKVNVEYRRRRKAKIARTIIRLRHSVNADDEIREYLDAETEALTAGKVARLDIVSILGELLEDQEES